MKEHFLELFCSQLEETDITQIDYDTDFKILDEWNSLLALSIIAMVDEEYSVRISGEDLKEARTIDNLFQLVKFRIK